VYQEEKKKSCQKGTCRLISAEEIQELRNRN